MKKPYQQTFFEYFFMSRPLRKNLLTKYFKDIKNLDRGFYIIPEFEAQIAESIYKTYFNRKKLLVVMWEHSGSTSLGHFFDNVKDDIIDKLIHDPEYHICFNSDPEGWNQIQFYVPLCASAASYNIPFSKLVFCTANLDVDKQYHTYAKRSGFSPEVKIIGYDHFLIAIARHIQEISIDKGSQLPFNFLDPEKYFDQLYKIRLEKEGESNIFLHLSRQMRTHRTYVNYLLDTNEKTRNLYSLSQNKFTVDQSHELHQTFNIPYKKVNNWRKTLPLTVDTKDFETNYADLETSFFTLYTTHLINIAGETRWDYNLFYSEKTYKPIVCMMPFVTYGTVGMNNALHTRYNFQLYDNLFDYSFDKEFDNVKRIDQMVKMLDNLAHRFSKLSWKEILNITMLQEKDKILHNYKTLLEFSNIRKQTLVTVNL